MERLEERLDAAAKAVAALEEAARARTPTLVERDSALLRLACAVEAVWKASQIVLKESEGIDAGSPKGCVRASVEAGLLDTDQGEWALKAVDDRNLIVHVYNEDLAREIHGRIPRHTAALRAWLEALRRRSRRH